MKSIKYPKPGNANKQDIDKAAGEERGKEEKVTTRDLKGKKVDADPEKKRDQPLKDTS
ncbi:MAG: hypothetical protein ACTHMV_09195 [Chitinophagaceae bacterium]